MVAHWKCEEDNPEITGSQSQLETDGNTEIAKCLGCPLQHVEMSLETLPGSLLAVLSPFSLQQENSVLDGRQDSREKIQESF